MTTKTTKTMKTETETESKTKAKKNRRSTTVRRLCRAAMFNFVRGTASAAGAAFLAWATFWVQSR